MIEQKESARSLSRGVVGTAEFGSQRACGVGRPNWEVNKAYICNKLLLPLRVGY
jgi:hypothetical protein